ncbi:hypothetical protein SEA_ECLIPTUS_78 [Gordonia phage Ecliptus]|nr:hypothetical protein SEA_ECLIPTUS_78 [Gordonia phage Ecliptus]
MIDYERRPAQYRGTIEVYEDTLPSDDDSVAYEWRWRCKANNHTIVASGQGYNRKAGALNAIDAQYSAKFTGAGAALNTAGHMAQGGRDRSWAETFILPWRLVVRDRHGDITTTGAVY